MLRLALLLMLFAVPLFGQSTPANCPTISVSGPAGIVPDGATGTFAVNITSAAPSLVPQFRWELTGGELIGGQGTRKIQVRFIGKTVVVNVEILGLPSECPSTASEAVPYSEPLTPVKVGYLLTDDTSAIKNEIDRVKAEMRAFPYDQLYILIGIQNGWKESNAERLEKLVIDTFSGPSEREVMDNARITMVRCGNKDLPVTIWRVPPGAENPDCNSRITQTPETDAKPRESECPTIAVIGPPGVIEPGESIEFSAKLDGELPTDLILTWTTIQGEILSGQGTTNIKVSTDPKFAGTTTTVTLKLSNLPPGCPSEAYETMPLIWEPLATLLNEVTGEAWKLPSFPASEMLIKFREEPSARLLIIGYFPKSTFQSRKANANKRMVAKIVSTNILSKDQIDFVDGGEDPAGLVRFRFYKVPEGADRPNP